MITIEAKLTREQFTIWRTALVDLVFTVERLDSSHINLIVTDEPELDELAEFLNDHGIEYKYI